MKKILLVRERSCGMVQGYVFSPPPLREDFIKLVASGKHLTRASS